MHRSGSGTNGRARPRILVVEDEPRLRDLLRLYLERDGYAVTDAGDGAAALAAYDADPPDLVILDLMLPRMQGETVLEELRDRGTVPVLITSAKRTDADRITGLRLGADDYLGKPFNPHEVTARVAAILRRSGKLAGNGAVGGGAQSGLTDAPALSLAGGRLRLDPATRRFVVRQDGLERTGRLTPGEARLLLALARRPGIVMTRDQLIDAVARRPDDVFERVVDVHVANLRRKLGDRAADPWLIETIPQAGYRLVAEVDAT
jgi:DNA-binding response OmpR family regulator